MSIEELKAISEPPPGSIVEIHTNHSKDLNQATRIEEI